MPRFFAFATWITSLAFAMDGNSHMDAIASRVLASTMATQYAQASAQADSMQAAFPEQAIFFRAMVLLSRYDDLGDTATLGKAKVILESSQAKQAFWESLRLFQLGYIQAEQGNSVSAALTTRKASKGFLAIGTLEARAFAAIYQYYLDGAMAWVPFRSDDRSQLLQTLDSASQSSKHFGPLYSTSLAWILFDRKEYRKAQIVVERILARYPNHPVFLQIKADMLYRQNKFQEAAALYEQSFRDYSIRGKACVRWWCAAGNLIRIYAALGDSAKMKSMQKLFEDPKFAQVKPFMPKSLMDALHEADLLPSK